MSSESSEDLKAKLRARRLQMDNTLRKKESTKIDSDVHDESVFETSAIESLTEDDDVTELKSELEHRREKSRRLLEKEEKESEEMRVSELEAKDSPPLTSSLSFSRSSTPFGRRTASPHSILQSRMQSRLMKKGSSALEDSVRFDRARRLRDRVSKSTRFMLAAREKEEESELVRQIESKLKWKRAFEEAKSLRGQPTEAECFDFFTKQFEDAPPDEEVVPTAPSEEQREAEAPHEGSPLDQEGGERASEQEATPEMRDQEQMAAELRQLQEQEEATEEKKLISDIIPKDLDWRLFDLFAAEYLGYTTQIENESQLYFVPSKLPAPMSDITARPRYLEDEGIFVGEKPVVLPTNRNRLGNRLLQNPGGYEGWFGPDGEVESLPNPLKKIWTKPWDNFDYGLDENLTTYYRKAYKPKNVDKNIEESGENELQINIGTVSFQHHPLMSKEHVLASNITKMYDEYIDMRQKNFVLFFVDKLTALRNAVSDLKNKSFSRSNPDEESGQESHLLDYMCEIRRTTRQLNKAESTERGLMRKIIEEWKEIKLLREQQGYINTTVKLTVKKEEVSRDQDLARWKDEVRLEIEERREEYKATVLRTYQEDMTKYRALLQEWKQNRQRIKEQRKSQIGAQENLLQSAEADDSEINIGGNIDKPRKPDKPLEFDEEAVKNEIVNDLIQCRRNPGEDKISLLLTSTTSITPLNAVPSDESARRKAVQKTSILLKVRFNGKEVFSTDPRPLSTDFKLYFGVIFRIRIVQWPESLRVQFCDVGLVVDSPFSDVYLRVPDTSVHAGNVQLGVVNFSSNQVVAAVDTAVGSNSPFTLKSNDQTVITCNTHGQLICSVSWGLDDQGQVLGPKKVAKDPLFNQNDPPSTDPISAIGADAAQDPKSVSKWVQDNRIDPNDPENAALIPFMQDVEGHALALDYFRLEQLQEEFNFVTDEEFTRMNRFRLLRLRHEEVNEFRNVAMVPCQEYEVMDSVFTTYERRVKESASFMKEGERFLESGTLSAHRLEVLKFRARVQEQVLNRFYAARHYRTFDDVVHEEQVPDIGTLGLAVGKIVAPRRPLKPVRRERKRATAQTLTDGSVNILVTVVRGYNIPMRETGNVTATNTQRMTPSLRRAGTSILQTAGIGVPNIDNPANTFSVAPFVAVSFQDNVVTTHVAQGPTPSWNEELKLPFSAPNSDYNPTSLQTVDDTLYVHLFDREVEEAPQRYNDNDPSLITHKITNHWLGTFRLPFSTLYHRGSIDGTFRLKVPPVLLGYTLEQPEPLDVRGQFDTQFTRLTSGTYLTLFITLDPILRPVEPVRNIFESKEDEAILAKSAVFLAKCHGKYPQRHVKTTVVNLKGESILITRYVKAIQPPAELTEGTEFASLNDAERLARFVSLIPFVSDNVTFAGVCDLWSTCDQFIHMLRGDEEEHAVLLLNYFLHRGKQAYLLLGNAVPEGDTAYVLTKEDATEEIYIWNASTGEYYSHNDNLCPLKSVGALVNDQNVWFNIQPLDMPARVRYDLTRKGDWSPLFPSGPPPTLLPSIQPDSIFYVTTDPTFVARLTQKITDTLKDKIMSWRPRHVTRWNRSCSSALLDVLRGLELQKLRREGTVDHIGELRRRLGEVKFSGFPMDLPYTEDVDSIVSAVRSTEVHKIQDPNVEFSLAVYIYPYPASVLAVWVYVAAIINRRRVEI